jgi:hypothetical protein
MFFVKKKKKKCDTQRPGFESKGSGTVVDIERIAIEPSRADSNPAQNDEMKQRNDGLEIDTICCVVVAVASVTNDADDDNDDEKYADQAAKSDNDIRPNYSRQK